MKLVAITLPWVELLCGLLLLANLWIDTALVATFGLLLVFVLLTAQAWIRGLNISCGCFNLRIFGISETIPSLAKFVESVAFAFFRNLALGAMGFFLLKSRLSDLKTSAAAELNSSNVSRSPATAALQKSTKQQKRAASVR